MNSEVYGLIGFTHWAVDEVIERLGATIKIDENVCPFLLSTTEKILLKEE